MKRIPEYILESINCGELKAEDFYEKYGRKEVELALESLKASDKEIFARIDSDKLFTSVSKQINKPARKHKILFYPGSIGLAAAAVFMLVFVPFIALRNNKTQEPVVSASQRIKGTAANPGLSLYRQDKDTVTRLKNGSFAQEGDVIQLSYTSGGKKYGLIFSVDGNHQITEHLGNDNLSSCSLENKSSLLDFSYELDSAPEYELFVIVTSDKPFNLEEKTEFIKSKSLNNIQKGEYLPEDASFSTFLLRK